MLTWAFPVLVLYADFCHVLSGSPIWLYFASSDISTINGMLSSGSKTTGTVFALLTQGVYDQLNEQIVEWLGASAVTST